MNLVMTGSGEFIELQGTGEESTFSDDQLAAMLTLGRVGIRELLALQEAAVGNDLFPQCPMPNEGPLPNDQWAKRAAVSGH